MFRWLLAKLGPLLHGPFLSVEALGDWIIVTRFMKRSDSRRGDAQLVIAGPGRGSIGDEAMCQAVSRNAVSPVVVVCRDEADLLTGGDEMGVRVVALDNLIYGSSLLGHWKSVRTLLDLFAGSASCAVVGADIMDGKYSVPAAVRRFRMVNIAAKLGLDARIMGFSWAATAHPRTMRAMRRLLPGVKLFARDPVSAQRMRDAGVANVTVTADLAFMTRPAAFIESDQVRSWVDQEDELGRPIVLINLNPQLVRNYPRQDVAYRELVRDLVDAGYACLGLPHDSRHDEAGHLRLVLREFSSNPAVFIAPDVLLPEQVVALASRCALVVSGRMHLIILSAVGGTPGVGLEYQGKFQGLYELLGLDLRVPQGDLARNLHDTVWDALERRDELRIELGMALPKARELARKNLFRHD